MKISLKKKLLMQFLIVGIVPLAVTAVIAYQLSGKFLEEGAFSKLDSVKNSKKSAVESYYENIRNQVVTLSESSMIVDAAKEFHSTFDNYTKKISSKDLNAMKKNVRLYYEQSFADEFKNQNNNNLPNVESMLEGLGNRTIALQNTYIMKNSNPLGSKHLLDDADDNSEYSKVHAKYHPVIRSYLEKFGYYDIFIVDVEDGHIVYSVFKELDFATSLMCRNQDLI